MSQENVEIVRAVFEAANRSDVPAMLKDAAPDFVYDHSRSLGPFVGVYGLSETRQFLDEFFAAWGSLRWEVSEFVDAGEQVVAPFTTYAQGRDGIEVQARAAFVWTLRDGAIARLCLYQERDEALEAAGLSE
jgi:ketosteroid isomerase-like protein